MSRKKRAKRQPRRPRPRVVILTEGTKTEPAYLNGFAAPLKRHVDIQVKAAKRSDPAQIVKKASELAGDQEVWVVFDHDGRDGLLAVFEAARANGVRVAFSNPCFELWLLLHFVDHPGPQPCSTLEARVTQESGDAPKSVTYGTYKPKVAEAEQRGEALNAATLSTGTCGDNPWTDVWRLTQRLRELAGVDA